MSQENVKGYFETLAKNKELQEKLTKLNKKYEGADLTQAQLDLACERELLPLAKEYGFEFTLEEYKAYALEMSVPKTGKLDDDELEAVSGGTGGCGCILAGGGGDPDNGHAGCACILGGAGINIDDMSGEYPPCLCPLAGAGILL